MSAALCLDCGRPTDGELCAKCERAEQAAEHDAIDWFAFAALLSRHEAALMRAGWSVERERPVRELAAPDRRAS